MSYDNPIVTAADEAQTAKERVEQRELEQRKKARAAFEARLARRGKVALGPDQIRSLLGFPDGYSIVTVYGEPDPPRFVVVVQCDELDPVPPGAEAPFLDGALTRMVVTVPSGKLYWRFEWGDGGDVDGAEAARDAVAYRGAAAGDGAADVDGEHAGGAVAGPVAGDRATGVRRQG